jgi:hypothetical protein
VGRKEEMVGGVVGGGGSQKLMGESAGGNLVREVVHGLLLCLCREEKPSGHESKESKKQA